MSCMAFKMIGTLHLIVVGEKDPTQADWTAYMQAVLQEERRGVDVTEMRTLVFSDGGGPNTAQRKIAANVLKGRSTPIAIVTGNAVMRGVITALRWFNPQCRTFAPDGVGEALKFLGIPLLKYDLIMKLARELQRQLMITKLDSLDRARLGPYTSFSVML
jgi:hypothetical protein